MARGDITIRAELRPCKVNLGARDGKAHIVNALFHGWNHYSKVIEPSPMVGGSPGGYSETPLKKLLTGSTSTTRVTK